MLTVVLVLQTIVLLALLALFVRKPAAAEPDSRLAQLPDQLSRLVADEAARSRKEAAESSGDLRKEVIASITTLGGTLKEGLDGFRTDNKTSGDQLRRAVEMQTDAITQRLSTFASDTNQQHT